MRLVFMGTPEFAIPSLAALCDHGYEVAAVVTVPDKPAGRGLHPSPSPVKRYAEGRGIPVLTPEYLRDPGFIGDLRALRPDCAVVVAFRILPREVYTIPALGSFNCHASLLPAYRGAAPINWAIINGETETGVTTFFLRDRVDTGDTILRKSVAIGPDETAGELHDRLATAGADAVLETVALIRDGKVAPIPQDEAGATPAPKIFTPDCRIDWTKGTAAIHNFIRGLSPRPGAFTIVQGRALKIFRSRLMEGGSIGTPGLLARDGERLTIGTGDGCIEILELQAEGKKRLPAAEYLRGASLAGGVKADA